MPQTRPSRRSAFTLVEVLVVIAIVVLLVALLLPSISRARYRAKETVCASNLRQVVLSATSYAADNNRWYPKNGAYRNSATSLSNGRYWDIKTLLKPYQAGFSAYVCPLTKDLVSNPKNPTSSTYNLLFNTYAAPVSSGPIACNSPTRLKQYDIYGDLITDGTTDYGSNTVAMQTWYYPYLAERDVMRKVGDTWTQTGTSAKFNVVAMDRCLGRGFPPQSRQSNHPDPGETWSRSGDLWQGVAGWNPATSANYAATDGSVKRYSYQGIRYYYDTMPEPVVHISGVGYIPLAYKQN